eukprot:GHVU01203512.1.p1 GENE.GHVU01203512.1~~GHVU01203512.1.p1  ORF type:complete len:291 (+),score=58.82 GHVU01203512.1:32-874(+)
MAQPWSEPRRVIEIVVPGKQVRVQSLWYNHPPRKISVHDIRKVAPEEEEDSRRANVEYLLRCAKMQAKGGERAKLLEKKLRGIKQAEKDEETALEAAQEEGDDLPAPTDEDLPNQAVAGESREVRGARGEVVVEVSVRSDGESEPSSLEQTKVLQLRQKEKEDGQASGATESEADWNCVYQAVLGPREKAETLKSRQRRHGPRAKTKTGTTSEARDTTSMSSSHCRSKPWRVDAVFSLVGPGVSGRVSPSMMSQLGVRADAACAVRGESEMEIEEEENQE